MFLGQRGVAVAPMWRTSVVFLRIVCVNLICITLTFGVTSALDLFAVVVPGRSPVVTIRLSVTRDVFPDGACQSGDLLSVC